MQEIVCHSPEETWRVGKELARELAAGDVVLLYGGLGAGKTLLTKGIMEGLGYDVDEVTSPSFALVNRYDTERLTVFHIDLWRLDRSADVAGAVGLTELLDDEQALVIIEWADRLGDAVLPARMVKVSLAGDGDEPRYITLDRQVMQVRT